MDRADLVGVNARRLSNADLIWHGWKVSPVAESVTLSLQQKLQIPLLSLSFPTLRPGMGMHAFRLIDYKDPDLHCLERWLPVMETHPPSIIPKQYSKVQFEILFTISSLHRELSPTRMLKWPGRNCVQIMCNTSSAYHVQYVVLHATWYEGTA